MGHVLLIALALAAATPRPGEPDAGGYELPTPGLKTDAEKPPGVLYQNTEPPPKDKISRWMIIAGIVLVAVAALLMVRAARGKSPSKGDSA